MRWRRARFRSRGVALLCLALGVSVVGACGSSTKQVQSPSTVSSTVQARRTNWSLRPGPMVLVRSAGLTPATREFFDYHVHAHLDVFVNGHQITIPGGIGIDITDPAVRHSVTYGAPGYGGVPPTGCPRPCISPLHTHFADGVIHIEARTRTQALFTLGRLFTEWGVPLTSSCVANYCRPGTDWVVYTSGKRVSGNPGDVPLLDHEEIAVVIGTPPQHIPSRHTFLPNEP